MPRHKVNQGEDLKYILDDPKHGNMPFEKVLRDPRNRGIFESREHNILNPGDDLFIPEKETMEYPGATEMRHVFKLKKPIRQLRLVMKDMKDQPLAYKKYWLNVDGTWHDEKETDAEGTVEATIPTDAKKGELHIAGTVFKLNIAHLDPVETVKGVQARLNNLGFAAGPVDGIFGQKTRRAVKRFQAKEKIKVDGILGPVAREHLKKAHGC